MDDSETYMNVKFTKTDSETPSRDEADVSYAEVNFKTLSAPRVRTDRDSLNTTYSELNIRKKKPRTDQYEYPSISSGPGGLSTSAQTDETGVSYAEVNFKTRSAPRVRTDQYGLNTTYSELNISKKKLPIDEEEDPAISSGTGGLSTSAQTAAHEKQSKVKIGNRPYRLTCLLCLVTFVLIVTVAGLSIYVSQISQSQITSSRNFQLILEQYQEMNRTQRQYQLQVQELNSTLESTISENSQLNLSRRTCFENLSALNSNQSELKLLNTHLRQQITEMETKYRSVNETKTQICELLTSRREQECSQGWIRNEGGCYFISTSNVLYNEARQYCSKSDSKLLAINSPEEENFVFKAVHGQGSLYWIGKCECRKMASNVLYRITGGESECGECSWQSESKHCGQVRTLFICEKSAPSCPDISEKIQDLCQEPMEPT